MNRLTVLTFSTCLCFSPLIDSAEYAKPKPEAVKVPVAVDRASPVQPQKALRQPSVKQGNIRSPLTGDKLLYVLKVPVEIKNLHSDVTSFGILCTVSPGKYIPYDPKLENMDWAYSYDPGAGGDLAGEGYTQVPIRQSSPNYSGVVRVRVEASNDKPTPKYYRCVLRLTDVSYSGHRNTIRWGGKQATRFPASTAAPKTSYRPVAEGTLP